MAWQWLGPDMPHEQAQLLATGMLNPHTLEPFEGGGGAQCGWLVG